MTERPTPFALVFGALARESFPAIATHLDEAELSSADRDRFVLLRPVGHLLQEIVPADAPAEAMEAHVRLLHHAYRHWTAGGWVYRIAPAALERAVTGGRFTSQLVHQALYLQLPELKVWGPPSAEGPAEPLDGIFVTETPRRAEIAMLGIFGMRPDRPGFSAVGAEGRADDADPTASEVLVAAERDDGTAAFSPLVDGGERAGLHTVANAGELLLLTCRLLALLPAPPSRGGGPASREGEPLERLVSVE